MSFEINLRGKTAIITGCLSGIGLGIAEQMAKAGANISGCSLEKDNELPVLLPVATENQLLYTCCDVTDNEQLDLLVERTIQKFGKIDILISNAGANIFKGASFTDQKDWNHNISLNLESHWQLAKKCQPYLKESTDGTIIIISSNHAYATIPGCFPYNVTKTALTGLVKSLSVEWGPEIRTIGLAPGFIDTVGNQKWFDSFPSPKKARQETIDSHPLKRIGTSDQIGGWCVFLSSHFASFSSGSTYIIDGGKSALL